jgi:hypothetical protein
MEVRLIARQPDKDPRARGAAFHLMSESESWADAPELGTLGAVLDQDTTNMELVHQGLKCSINGQVELGDYQEVRIRHFHQVLDRYLNAQ